MDGDLRATARLGDDVRLYYEVAKRAFARQTVYRAATLAGLAANSFFGAMRTYLYIALFAGSGVVAGWTVDDTVNYVWIGQAIIMPVYLWGWQEIALTIRSGDVISDLSKPFDYYSFWLAQDAGRAVYHTLFRAVPTLAVGLLLFDVRLTADPAIWLAFLLSLVGAVWISFGLRFLANIASFWLLDYRAMIVALMFGTSFFSGHLVPLNFWPEWARDMVIWLPFAGMVQAPVEVLLGKALGVELAALLAFQFGWGLALMLLGRAVLALAVRKVVVQGG